MASRMQVQIYGRKRFDFQKLFPTAAFEGYECNIRYCYFNIATSEVKKVERVCSQNLITILGFYKN